MANRFWVGGTGTWDAVNTANWSTTSGGAGGASVPVAADQAFFNALSGGGTVTLAYTPVILSFGVSGFSGIIDFNGNIVQVAGNGITVFSQDIAASFAGTPIIELTYAGATGTRTLGAVSGANEAKAVNIRVLAGTDIIATGNNRSYRNMDFTGFSGTLTNTIRTIYGSLTLSAGITLTAGTTTTNFAATSGTHTHTFAGKTLDFPVTFNAPGSTQVFNDALVVGATRTLTLTAGTIKFKSAATSSAGTFTIVGSPSVTINATTAGSAATISQTTGTVNVSNATIKDITATGGATWNAFVTNNNVNDGGNTGWDFFTQVGRYMYNVRKSKRILI